MSREYIFRGKSKETGKWVYGSLLKFHGFQIFDYTLNAWVSVDGHTIGQYTGVSDDRGNMIYEGDWITNPNNPYEGVGIVYFAQGAYYIRFTQSNILPLDRIHSFRSEIMVVGNIIDENEGD